MVLPYRKTYCNLVSIRKFLVAINHGYREDKAEEVNQDRLPLASVHDIIPSKDTNS